MFVRLVRLVYCYVIFFVGNFPSLAFFVFVLFCFVFGFVSFKAGEGDKGGNERDGERKGRKREGEGGEKKVVEAWN